ncbi:MAG TPA: hypothetical protein VJ323_14395 [Bryobacteraceae bacterium]|jgi:hypothetical protein|nr:hypothetical protein [Bryobacteraceae bacterium]
MREEERLALAVAFIEHFSSPYVWDENLVLEKRDKSDTEWASSKVIDLALEQPEELWDFILEVLKRDPPDDVIEVLAAGPLEDYIAKLGERVIERVEQQAAGDPKFRNLLCGVWRNSMSDDVWRQVQACWDRSGWDGNV